MLAALRAYPGFDGRNPRAWLLTIARRKAIDEHGRRSRRPEALAEPDAIAAAGGADEGPMPSSGPGRALPPKQRAAVVLRSRSTSASRCRRRARLLGGRGAPERPRGGAHLRSRTRPTRRRRDDHRDRPEASPGRRRCRRRRHRRARARRVSRRAAAEGVLDLGLRGARLAARAPARGRDPAGARPPRLPEPLGRFAARGARRADLAADRRGARRARPGPSSARRVLRGPAPGLRPRPRLAALRAGSSGRSSSAPLRSRSARRGPTARLPQRRARRGHSARPAAPWARTRSRSSCRATAFSGPAERSVDTAAASTSSASCSPSRGRSSRPIPAARGPVRRKRSSSLIGAMPVVANVDSVLAEWLPPLSLIVIATAYAIRMIRLGESSPTGPALAAGVLPRRAADAGGRLRLADRRALRRAADLPHDPAPADHGRGRAVLRRSASPDR